MKIGLFDPYLDTLGGGERYILSIASYFQHQHEVFLFWDNTDILKKAKERFLLNLDRISIKPNIFTKDTDVLTRLKKTYGLDYLFYISDGSIPIVASRHVIPIVQFPIENLNGRDIYSRVKLFNTSMILCYSDFVKKYLKDVYATQIRVLYPSVPKIQAVEKKENIILSVGRFTKGNNTKNQEMLLHFFKRQYKLHFKNWKLVFAGSYLPEDENFVMSLKKQIDKAPIEIHTNITYAQLCRLYARSKIYWHAAGYGKDITRHPRYAEHFGISVVEAMSVGSVPVVFNGGGLPEIVTDGENGYLWDSEKYLFEKTKILINDSWVFEKLSNNAIRRSSDFSEREFNKNLSEIIQ